MQATLPPPQNGCYESAAFRVLGHLIRPGMTAIDVGANAGVFSEFLFPLLGRQGRLVVVEPVPWHAADLRSRWAGEPNVSLLEAALAESSHDSIPFYLDEHLQGGRRAGVYSSIYPLPDPDGRSLTPHVVACDTLDALCERERLTPHFIKIDAEGAEPRVLAGGRNTLRQFRPILLLEMWQWMWRLGYRECFLELESLGYRIDRLEDRRRVDHHHYDHAELAGTVTLLARPSSAQYLPTG